MSLQVDEAERPDAAGFVLAGGQSSRMGADKALVQLDGETMVARALGILREAGLDAAIAGARSDLSHHGRVVMDAARGPLGGICAALEATSAAYALFISVDMPLLAPALVAYVLEHAQRTVAGISLVSVAGFAQTFPAVIHRDLLPALRSAFEGGNDGCFSAFRAAANRAKPFQILPVENLVQAGQIEDARGLPPAYWFLNVNTPDDLARAQSLLSRAIA